MNMAGLERNENIFQFIDPERMVSEHLGLMRPWDMKQ